MSRDNEINDDLLKKAYRSHCAVLSQTRLQITIVLAISLVMAFGLLDFIVYPQLARDLLNIRVITGIILVLIFTALRRKQYQNSNFIGISVVLLIFFLIDILIFFTEGMSSPYYAGLNLALVAFSAMLPWQSYETLFSFGVMLISYLWVTFSYSNINDVEYFTPLLINNLFFLVSVGVFCIVATYLNSRLRFREFSLNYNLDYNLKKETLKLQSTQAQLVQSEKMSAIGNLSAGLLHEVNNPLNYTMTAIQIMKMDPSINADPELQDTVKDIEEGMTRIKNIVTDLRAFAYPEEADKKNKFPILNAVENSLRFTASECQDVKRIVNIDENLMVSASKTHVVQVLINLISNASRAIHRVSEDNYKGVISIEAKEEGTRVVVSVFDNGTGMSEATLKRVFDPFFTTNEVGKGMGLGLSVSHTIVKNHGGNLSATSKLGEGSRFFFDLGV